MVNCGYEIICEFWLEQYERGFVVGYNKNKNEYVVWDWDKNTNSYFWGHYFLKKDDAIKTFRDCINYTLKNTYFNN